jgi:hypothetical protein
MGVYPGHALTIAVAIMEKYPSLEEARKKGRNYPQALEDNDIPGAGGPVYCALDVLAIGDDDKAIEQANYFWQGECGESYASRYDEGMQEAKALESRFRELRKNWS